MSTKKYENLEPCPFCGGEAVIRTLLGNIYICPIHEKFCTIRPNTWLISNLPIKDQIKVWNKRYITRKPEQKEGQNHNDC